MKAPNTSIVLASQKGDLHRLMFDERQLFGGDLDRVELAAGPVGEFSYASGKFEFTVAPDRIFLRNQGDEILPETIEQAAASVLTALSQHQVTSSITAVGLNMEREIIPSAESPEGAAFCASLVDADTVSTLVGSTEPQLLFLRSAFVQDELQYQVQIEPHIATEGQRLYLSVNVHQDTTGAEDLASKVLGPFGIARSYMEGLLERCMVAMRGKIR